MIPARYEPQSSPDRRLQTSGSTQGGQRDTAQYAAIPGLVDGTAVRRPRRGWRRWVLPILAFLLLVGPVLELALVGAIYVQARADQSRAVDAIVVLGTTQYNGRPSPTLEARLSKAVELYGAGYAPTIIVTGGSMPGDVYTEAESGQMYLEAAGIPATTIVLENGGRDSWQSMNGVAGILAARNFHSILIVSDGFHLLRLKMMARDLDIKAWSVASDGSPIKGGQEFGYVVREALAITAFVFGRR